MPRISALTAREILDSRGRPTVEVDIHLEGGAFGRASVPSGASTGRAEACELRDGDPARYDGRGVLRAVDNIHREILPAVRGLDAADQAGLDATLISLDGTPQKTRLGANAILGVSLAVAHVAAASQNIPLYQHLAALYAAIAAEDGGPAVSRPRTPLPMTNMISGGLHAGGNLDFQDFLILPLGAPDYPTALEWIVRVYNRLGALLTERGFEGRLVGDEGGFGPRLASNEQAAELIIEAIGRAGLEPGRHIALCLDVAATHFCRNGVYRLAATGGAELSSDQMAEHLERMLDRFPIWSIEDALAEDDWLGWSRLTQRVGGRVRLVGDDLFATNEQRLALGAEAGAANAVLIKVNQIGTLSETFATLRLADRLGYARIVSARSGETEDSTLADLATAVAADAIKIGSIVRSERLAKYNQLLRIDAQLRGAS